MNATVTPPARPAGHCEPDDLIVVDCPSCIPADQRHEDDCQAHPSRCGCDVNLAGSAVIDGLIHDQRFVSVEHFEALRDEVLGALRAVRAQYGNETA